MSASPDQMTDVLGRAGPPAVPGGLQFTPPDTSAFDKQIADERQVVKDETAKAQEYDEKANQTREKAAADLAQGTQAQDQAYSNVPTRQAIYQQSMQAAPLMAIMMAVGGKAAKLSGQNMLGAMTGAMTGLNEGSEARFQDAMTKWKAEIEKARARLEDQEKYNQMMLEAYAGRADAHQKAAAAAYRMSGDLISDKQQQYGNSLDLFKLQRQIVDSADQKRLEIERLAETQRHDRATEGVAQAKVDIQRGKDGGLTDQSTDSLAEQAMSGDTTALQGLKPADKVKVRNRIADLQQIRGLTGADQAAANAQFQGMKAGERTLGTRQANIDMAVQEALNIEPIVREASKKVDRAKFVPWNQLFQIAEKGDSDPDVYAFAQAAKSFANIYTRATVPGAGGVNDREEAVKHLPIFTDDASFQKVLDIMDKEMRAAKQSPGQVREDMRRAITGREQPTPSGSSPATPAPHQALPTSTPGTINWADLPP